MEIVDLTSFVSGEILLETEFVENIKDSDWDRYQDKNVLVRGCGEAPLPIWAFMMISAKLTPVAKTIRYGNEHSNIVIYRRSS